MSCVCDLCELKSVVLQGHESPLKDTGWIEASIDLGGGKSEGIIRNNLLLNSLAVHLWQWELYSSENVWLSTFSSQKQY